MQNASCTTVTPVVARELLYLSQILLFQEHGLLVACCRQEYWTSVSEDRVRASVGWLCTSSCPWAARVLWRFPWRIVSSCIVRGVAGFRVLLLSGSLLIIRGVEWANNCQRCMVDWDHGSNVESGFLCFGGLIVAWRSASYIWVKVTGRKFSITHQWLWFSRIRVLSFGRLLFNISNLLVSGNVEFLFTIRR